MYLRSITALFISVACLGCGSSGGESYKLYSLDGQTTITQADYKGKVVVLDFWATWCGPCKMIQPVIHKWADEYAAKGVVFLGVTEEDPKEVTKFVNREPLGYPAVIDRGDLVDAQFKVDGFPTLVILDRSGQVAFTGNPLDTEKVVSALNQLTSGK